MASDFELQPLSAKNRDQKILAHVLRFRLTTLAALMKVVLPGLSRNAVNKIRNRLCARSLLCKYDLVYPTKYFMLGESAARALGAGNQRAKSLGAQSLPQEFALLAFATLGTKRHLRLDSSEIQAQWPWMPAQLASVPHCVDQDGVLELIRVDLGGPADHVARKCASDLAKRSRIPEFLPFVSDGQFRLVVITATSGKANAIQRSLNNHSWPRGLQIHFSIVPQLLSIGVSANHA